MAVLERVVKQYYIAILFVCFDMLDTNGTFFAYGNFNVVEFAFYLERLVTDNRHRGVCVGKDVSFALASISSA